MKNIAIIGSGFSGLSAACYLAAAGNKVHVFEKNAELGGRARQFVTEAGYVFDMGPSWYWMPEVFENFFNDFGHCVSDFYDLKLLNPSFDVVYELGDKLSIPENFDLLCNMFESIEKGSAKQLVKFMHDAEFKYNVGMNKLVHKPGLSLSEFADFDLISGVLKLDVFSSFSNYVRKYFTHPKLIALMEFPVIFLGAMPQDIPALYSLMNYAGLKLGTWYPTGGFGKVIEAMVEIAKKNGVTFYAKCAVEKIIVEDNLATGIVVNNNTLTYDAIIASADYNHIETQLLPNEYRNYSDIYWNKKTLAPSCLIFYLGVKKKVKNLEHHTLFFDESLTQHSAEIYKNPQWPTKPLFYVCCPSKTDDTVAPKHAENLFLLMPLAPGIEDNEELREKYFNVMMTRLEMHTHESINDFIEFKKSYCINDFVLDYNSFKGNAYGLANTLMQTANLKPKIINKKIKNLFYAGQLTVPGPGVPPSIISGKIAATLLNNYLKKQKK